MLLRSSDGEADIGDGADGAYVTDGADDDAERVMVMVQILLVVMLVME